MKKIYIFIAYAALATTIALGQSSEILKVADSLTSISEYDHNGWAGTPKEWILQQELNRLCSNDDLVALANTHHNAAVRAYTFKELVARADTRFIDILYNSLHDTARFYVRSGDIRSNDNVTNYRVNILVYKHVYISVRNSAYSDSVFDNNTEMNDFRRIFSIQDSITLDSILLFTPNINTVRYKTEIIDKLPLNEKYYKRLFEMVTKEGFYPALSALCRYKNEEIKTLIKNLLQKYTTIEDSNGAYDEATFLLMINALSAVESWPNLDFIPSITEILNHKFKNSVILMIVYRTLMAYDDEQSYRLIEESIATKSKNKDAPEIQYIIDAYQRIKKPRYKPIITKYCSNDIYYKCFNWD